MKIYRRFVTVALSLALLMFLAGCDTTQTTNNPAPAPNNPTPQPQPVTFPGFNLQANPPIVPFPNSIPGILVNPVTGQNTVPGAGEPFDSINSLFGYSTSGNLLIPFEGGVRPETVTNDTIQMYNTVTGDQVLLAFQVVNDPSGSSLVVATPVLPLVEDTDYVVVITSNVIGAASGLPVLSSNLINVLKNATPIFQNGQSQVFGLDDATAKQLEPVRQALQPSWLAAEAATNQSRANIPFAYIYHTQPLYDTLQNLVGQAEMDNPVGAGPVQDPSIPLEQLGIVFPPNNQPIAPVPINFAAGGSVPYVEFPPGSGEFVPQDVLLNGGALPPFPSVQAVFAFFEQNVPADRGGPLPVGTVLNAAGDPGQGNVNIAGIYLGSLPIPNYLPTLASQDVDGFFSNPPVPTEILNVPFIAFVPPGPIEGVVIYQHGLGLNKSEAFLLAQTVTARNQALIAIDLPDHGFLNPIPADGDGAHFINLTSLRRSRDNIRQAVVNESYLTELIQSGLTNLNNAIAVPLGGGFPIASPAMLPAEEPGFMGRSLGGIVGGVHAAVDPNARRSVLNVTGGRISSLLINSAFYGPPVIQGLADLGIQQGTVEFLQFFIIAQTVVDDGDPINYARHWQSGALSGTPTQILMQEAIGDGTIPNSATEDLARSSLASGTPINQLEPILIPIPPLPVVDTPTAVNVSGIYQFMTGASHTSFVQPTQVGAAERDQALTMLLQGFIEQVFQRTHGTDVEPWVFPAPGAFFGK